MGSERSLESESVTVRLLPDGIVFSTKCLSRSGERGLDGRIALSERRSNFSDYGPLIEIYALDELADPGMLDLYNIASTVPFPDDLGPWLEALPIDIVKTEAVMLGETSAIFWEITPNEEKSLEIVGDLNTVIAASTVNEFASIQLFADFPEQHILWHIETSNGPILAHMMAFGAGDIAFAESVLESIVFE